MEPLIHLLSGQIYVLQEGDRMRSAYYHVVHSLAGYSLRKSIRTFVCAIESVWSDIDAWRLVATTRTSHNVVCVCDVTGK